MIKRAILTLCFVFCCLPISVSAQLSQASSSDPAQYQPSLSEQLPEEIFAARSSSQESSSSQAASMSSLSNFEELLYKSQSSGSEPETSLGVLDLEEHIASGRYAAKSGLRERAILVRAYERVIIATCFPPISAIVKGIKLQTLPKRCEDTLKKLSELHSNNTIAECAQKGVDSVDCASSFETQAVRKYVVDEFEKYNLTGKTTSTINSTEVKAKFDQLQKTLLDRIEKFKKESSITNLKAIDSVLYPILNIICSDDALELTLQPASPPMMYNNPTASVNSLAQAIDALNAEDQRLKPTPTVDPHQQDKNIFYRSRLLSDSCYDTITDVLTLDPRFSSAICYRDGFIAPSCISSIKRMQLLSEPTPTAAPNTTIKPSNGPKNGKDGLATF